MLTPQEVSERAFQKASFVGYNMAQVDEFLDILTKDYSTLYSENAVLKSKMKVLVEKVEEYRSTEEAMRKALMTAQRMADELVKEAEQKREEILQSAQTDAVQRKQELCQELEAEQFRLEQAQQATQAFVEKVRGLQADQERLLSNLQQLYPPQPEPPVADPIEAAAEEIDESVQRLLAQAMMNASVETARSRQPDRGEEASDLEDTAEFSPISAALESNDEDEDEDEEDGGEEEQEDEISRAPGNRIDFGTLQFGRDYEIK